MRRKTSWANRAQEANRCTSVIGASSEELTRKFIAFYSISATATATATKVATIKTNYNQAKKSNKQEYF